MKAGRRRSFSRDVIQIKRNNLNVIRAHVKLY